MINFPNTLTVPLHKFELLFLYLLTVGFENACNILSQISMLFANQYQFRI